MKGLEIIEYQRSDLSEIIELFRTTVVNICKNDYTKPQLVAWAEGDIEEDSWHENFENSYTIVAKSNGVIVGFANISDSGYIDMMYVHHKFQNRGIGTALYNDIEKYAKSYYFMTLSTHSSITARAFFLRCGFTEVKKQQVIRNSLTLDNYVCKKFIGGNYK